MRFLLCCGLAAGQRSLKAPSTPSLYVTEVDIKLATDAKAMAKQECGDLEPIDAEERADALQRHKDYAEKDPGLMTTFSDSYEYAMDPSTCKGSGDDCEPMQKFTDNFEEDMNYQGSVMGLAMLPFLCFSCMCCCWWCCCCTTCPCCGCCLSKCCCQRKEPKEYMRITKLIVLGLLGFLSFLIFIFFVQGQVGAAKLPTSMERTECVAFSMIDDAITGTDRTNKNYAGTLTLLTQIEGMLDMLTPVPNDGGAIDQVRDLLSLTEPVEQTVYGLSAIAKSMQAMMADDANAKPNFKHTNYLSPLIVGPLADMSAMIEDSFATVLNEAREAAQEALSDENLAKLRDGIEGETLKRLEESKSEMRELFYDLEADFNGEEVSEDSSMKSVLDAWSVTKEITQYVNQAAQGILAWSFLLLLSVVPILYFIIMKEKAAAGTGPANASTSDMTTKVSCCGWCCGCGYVIYAMFLAIFLQSITWPLSYTCSYMLAMDEVMFTDMMALTGVGDKAAIAQGLVPGENPDTDESQVAVDIINTCLFRDGDIFGVGMLDKDTTECFSDGGEVVPKTFPPKWEHDGFLDSVFMVTDPNTGMQHSCEKKTTKEGVRPFVTNGLTEQIDPAFEAINSAAADIDTTIAEQQESFTKGVDVLVELLSIPMGNMYFLDPDQLESFMEDPDYKAMAYDKRNEACKDATGDDMQACVMASDSLMRGFFVSAGCDDFDTTSVKTKMSALGSDVDLSVLPDLIRGNQYFRDSIASYPGVVLSGTCGNVAPLASVECSPTDEGLLFACSQDAAFLSYCGGSACVVDAMLTAAAGQTVYSSCPGATKTAACPAVAAANLARLREEGLQQTFMRYPVVDATGQLPQECAPLDSDSIAYDCVEPTAGDVKYRIGQAPFTGVLGEGIPCSFAEFDAQMGHSSKQLGKAVDAMLDEVRRFAPQISTDLRAIIDNELLPPIFAMMEKNNVNCAFIGDALFGLIDAVCVDLVGGFGSINGAIMSSALTSLFLTLLIFTLWRHFVDNRMAVALYGDKGAKGAAPVAGEQPNVVGATA